MFLTLPGENVFFKKQLPQFGENPAKVVYFSRNSPLETAGNLTQVFQLSKKPDCSRYSYSTLLFAWKRAFTLFVVWIAHNKIKPHHPSSFCPLNDFLGCSADDQEAKVILKTQQTNVRKRARSTTSAT